MPERLANTGGGALIYRFEFVPEILDLRFLIKIGENLAEAIERKRAWRQCLTLKHRFEAWGGPGNQGKGHETGESGAGIGERVMAIVSHAMLPQQGREGNANVFATELNPDQPATNRLQSQRRRAHTSWQKSEGWLPLRSGLSIRPEGQLPGRKLETRTDNSTRPAKGTSRSS